MGRRIKSANEQLLIHGITITSDEYMRDREELETLRAAVAGKIGIEEYLTLQSKYRRKCEECREKQHTINTLMREAADDD